MVSPFRATTLRKLCGAAQLRAEGVFVQPDFRRTAGNIVDGQHIEARWAIVQMTIRQEALCGAHQHTLFSIIDAQLRQARNISTHSARPDFHESDCFPVVSHQIQFALGALRHIIFCDENVALPAQIPVTIRFSEQASATRLFLALEFLTPLRFFILILSGSVSRGIAQATVRAPTHNGKYQTRKYWHELPGWDANCKCSI